jgi:hypothetical protein
MRRSTFYAGWVSGSSRSCTAADAANPEAARETIRRPASLPMDPGPRGSLVNGLYQSLLEPPHHPSSPEI